ncbi:MAG: hypothetical protein HYS21_00860 [Deltaproteobacteria bacterium]|nr:hypothetical protein [Deltaproteobacteria bacterium]
MKDEALLALLEEATEKLSIKLGYENLRKGEVISHGGIFVLRGEKRILIHNGLTIKDKIEVLLDILTGLDTEGVHLPPEVRERIEAARRHKHALQAE